MASPSLQGGFAGAKPPLPPGLLLSPARLALAEAGAAAAESVRFEEATRDEGASEDGSPPPGLPFVPAFGLIPVETGPAPARGGSPEASDSSRRLHEAFGWASMVPGPAGMGASLLDAGVYVKEKNFKEALFSALNCLPFLGVFKKIAKAAKAAKKLRTGEEAAGEGAAVGHGMASAAKAGAKGYRYLLDRFSRPIQARAAELKIVAESERPPRNFHAQALAGMPDRCPTDQGGHLIARLFGGSSGPENLVAMDRELNRGAWKKMEDYFRKQIEQGRKVSFTVKPIYEGKSMRPSRFEVTFAIDGKKKTWKPLNGPNQKWVPPRL